MMSPDNELPAWVSISLILYSPMLSVCDRARLFGAILSPFIHYRFRATCWGIFVFCVLFRCFVNFRGSEAACNECATSKRLATILKL